MEEQSIFKGKPLIAPTSSLRATASISPSEASRLLHSDPKTYWEGIASELFWYSGWNQTLEGGFGDFRYFAGGLSNVSFKPIFRPILTLRLHFNSRCVAKLRDCFCPKLLP